MQRFSRTLLLKSMCFFGACNVHNNAFYFHGPFLLRSSNSLICDQYHFIFSKEWWSVMRVWKAYWNNLNSVRMHSEPLAGGVLATAISLQLRWPRDPKQEQSRGTTPWCQMPHNCPSTNSWHGLHSLATPLRYTLLKKVNTVEAGDPMFAGLDVVQRVWPRIDVHVQLKTCPVKNQLAEGWQGSQAWQR